MDIPNRIPNTLDAFCHIIGDPNVVFFLKLHDHFDSIKRVRAQVSKSSVGVDLVRCSTKCISGKLRKLGLRSLLDFLTICNLGNFKGCIGAKILVDK